MRSRAFAKCSFSLFSSLGLFLPNMRKLHLHGRYFRLACYLAALRRHVLRHLTAGGAAAVGLGAYGRVLSRQSRSRRNQLHQHPSAVPVAPGNLLFRPRVVVNFSASGLLDDFIETNPKIVANSGTAALCLLSHVLQGQQRVTRPRLHLALATSTDLVSLQRGALAGLCTQSDRAPPQHF